MLSYLWPLNPVPSDPVLQAALIEILNYHNYYLPGGVVFLVNVQGSGSTLQVI